MFYKNFMKILVTGAGGYIGGMLVEKLLKTYPDVFIIGIDLLPEPEKWKDEKRVFWIKGDLAKNFWQEKVLSLGKLDVLVHCAFRIRTPFGKVKAYEKNNLLASKNVFEFAFQNNIPHLVYLSTVSSYGARKENIGRLIKEEEPFLETKNPYGYQKKLVEEELKNLFEKYQPSTKVTVLRLNSVTGPKGQSLSSKFGLITFLKKLLPFVLELNTHWARQFVHEDDVLEIIFLSFNRDGENFAVYNVAPSQFLEVGEIAKILNKKTIHLPIWFVKLGLFLLWPISFGKLIPPQAVDGLVYPINVDGSKVEKELGFHYRYSAKDAFLGQVGNYFKN